MNRKRTSIVWDIPDNEFIEIVKKAKTYKDVKNYIGLIAASSHKTITKRIKEMKLDTSHFLNAHQVTHLNTKMTKSKFISEWLNPNTEKSGTHLKRYLLRFDLLKYECNICGNTGRHMNKDLALQVDHINGIHDDNRLNNLRFLCPNCHTQTKTWGSRNINFIPTLTKVEVEELSDKYSYSEIREITGITPNNFKKHLKFYDIKKYRNDKNSINTTLRNKRAKSRGSRTPCKDELKALIWEKPTTHIAKDFKVSDKTVEKWCKGYNISKPPRGYWVKKKYKY